MYLFFSEKAMAPHSSTLAWRIPWMEEPGGLQSMGSLESDMTERLHFHFSLSCIGGGNGNPLQCSCLENPRDGGAWWAAVYGVARSRTRLKRLSSSSMYLFELFKLKRNLNNSCFIYPVLWLEIQLFEENLPKKCFHLPWTKKGEQTKTPTCDATDVLCWAAQKHFFLLIKIF